MVLGVVSGILNNDLKGAPAPHTVLSIVSTIYKERELSKLLSKVEGPIGEMLRECYSLFVKEKLDHKYDVDLNDILSDRVNYLIYKLAANKKGTTKIKIVELFGLLGEKRLNSLLNLGLILEKDEAIHAKDKNFSLDIKIAKKLLPELIDFYNSIKENELQTEIDQFATNWSLIQIFNQFEEFGNPLWHYHVTGSALEDALKAEMKPGSTLRGAVSSSGSAGTMAYGYYLKTKYPQMKLAAAEALQCPTLLNNGFGGHRIEGARVDRGLARAAGRRRRAPALPGRPDRAGDRRRSLGCRRGSGRGPSPIPPRPAFDRRC